MNKCPSCQQMYSDDVSYCLSDGTFLVSASIDVPTLVIPAPRITIPKPPVSTGAPRTTEGRSPVIYATLGGLGVLVIVLGALAWYLGTARSVTVPAEGKKPVDVRNDGKTATPTTTIQGERPADSATVEAPPQLIEADAASVIDIWESAQNKPDFSSYRALYSPTFRGKKTKQGKGSQEMGYAAWMADRGRSFKNLLNVVAENRSVTIEGDVAVVKFIQRFRSEGFCDYGDKTIHVKMFANGAKIVYEDLKNAITVPC